MTCQCCDPRAALEAEAREIIAHCGGGRAQAIPVLQEIQRRHGYLPRDLMQAVCCYGEFSESQLFGVATFYSQFRFTPQGEYLIKVCTGTACHVAGAADLIDAISQQLDIEVGQTTDDGLFSLESVACLGCCSLAPVVMINDRTIGQLDPLKIQRIIDEYRHE